MSGDARHDNASIGWQRLPLNNSEKYVGDAIYWYGKKLFFAIYWFCNILVLQYLELKHINIVVSFNIDTKSTSIINSFRLIN